MPEPSHRLAELLLRGRFLSPEEFVAGGVAPPLIEDDPHEKPFGKYRLIRRIGEGGFSRVYLAVDPLLGRRVALKILKSATPEDVGRFRREARIAMELRHSNIMPVYETGQIGRAFYIAMAYVDGVPAEKIERRRFIDVMLKTARALGVAHARGLIHRDVKPSNILITPEGEPYLTDFGMAKRYDGSTQGMLTQSGTMIGTPAFMSPEQARGEARSLGPASDVFSLGSTFYYLATGVLPFGGSTPLEIIRKVIETRPRPPREFDPSLPSEVAAIITKAMAPDPTQRYQTAAEMADDLDRFSRRLPVVAARRRFAPYVAAAVALAIVSVLVALRGRRDVPPQPVPIALEAPTISPPLPPLPPLNEPPPPASTEDLPAPPELPAIAPALKAHLRERVFDQPAYFLETFLSDAERVRAEQLLASDRATEVDLRFLTERIGKEAAECIERERRSLQTVVAEREADVRLVHAPDLVRFKDGRRQEVRLIEETTTRIRYVFQDQPLEVSRDLIEAVEPGGSAEGLFQEKLRASVKAVDFVALAKWCREHGLPRHREYALYRALAEEPGDGGVRRELGMPASGPLAAALAGRAPIAWISFEGREYAPEDLRQALLSRGYLIVDDRWCVSKEWRWSAREYWNGGLTVSGRGVTIGLWEEVRVEKAYDLDQRKVVSVVRRTPKFHFIGPLLSSAEAKAAACTAVIAVEAPGPILECRLQANATVMDGRGSIDVSLETEGRSPRILFSLAAGTRRSIDDIGADLRGARRFSIVASIRSEIEPDAEGRPKGFALFLPGDAAEPEPLWIEGRVAEPVPALNELLPLK
ncbi:MAG: serine/threonine protein kinase [Planctomycetes bacterium]|nr:serine/threonine protein kinase [Planctomycetota bacterium]